MITENICPAINLANGTRGLITDTVLDPREADSCRRSTDSSHPIQLSFPPLYIVVEVLHTSATSIVFDGLPPKQIPIFPVTRHFFIGSKPRTRVTRRQLPITLSYAFTDFKSQGQTLPYVVIDIGKTTSFALTPFNVYVALSRGQRRSTIRLLRDFEDNLFTRHPSESLRYEDERLQGVAQKTRTVFQNGGYSVPL